MIILIKIVINLTTSHQRSTVQWADIADVLFGTKP